MRYLPTAKEMKQGDSLTIEQYQVPSMVLMERAALQTVEAMEKHGVSCDKVLVVCGSGNNGGDGFAIARLLHIQKKCVTVFVIGKESAMTEETKLQKQIAENYGVLMVNELPQDEYSVIIDAVFGIGLSRNLGQTYITLLTALNEKSGVKIAVDIPSGVCATTGRIYETAFRADYTVTFGYEKLGMTQFPAHIYCGAVIVADIGITEEALDVQGETAYTLERKDLSWLIPNRKVNSHKGSYGKVVIFAGSKGMAGAAYFSAKACLMTGAGMVKIVTCESNRMILQGLLPEAMVSSYEENCITDAQIEEELKWADIALIGCGIGTTQTAVKLLEGVMRHIQIPCVIDADGLNLLSERMELLSGKAHVILTPHMMELARLLHCEIEDVKSERMDKCRTLTKSCSAVCVAKDARTMVFQKGKPVFVNLAGNSSMAKAGSGDVLAGVITGLRAQGMSDYDAARTGVYLHALGGDLAKSKKGSYSVLAEDLIEHIGCALKEYEGKK